MGPEQSHLQLSEFLKECADLSRENGKPAFRAACVAEWTGIPVLVAHKCYTLCCCTGGAVLCAGGEELSLQAGDLVLLPPGTRHSFRATEGTAPEMWILCFNDGYVRHRLAGEADMLRGVRCPLAAHTDVERQEVLAAFAACVLEPRERRRNWERICQSMIALLVCVVDRQAGTAPEQELWGDKTLNLLRVMDYVDERLGRQITLEGTARAFSVSASTLSQTFRKKTGVSFYAFVIQRRMEAACGQIAQGLPLEQVGRQVGFAEYSAFYRAFKRQYGVSPRAYRAQIGARPPCRRGKE